MAVLLTRGGHLTSSTDPRRLRTTLWYSLPIGAAFALSIPLYALVGPWAFFLWGVVPLPTSVVGVRARRRASGVRPSEKDGDNPAQLHEDGPGQVKTVRRPG